MDMGGGVGIVRQHLLLLIGLLVDGDCLGVWGETENMKLGLFFYEVPAWGTKVSSGCLYLLI